MAAPVVACCRLATTGVAHHAQSKATAAPAGCFRMSSLIAHHQREQAMRVTANIPIGAAAEQVIEVTREMTVAHFVEAMPAVYGTPIMIYHMETTAGAAIT